MEKYLIPFELAKNLKAKGFDEICLRYYLKNKNIIINGCDKFHEGFNYNTIETRISAPMYQQVVDWFREKHNIELYCPNYYKNSKDYKPEYESRVNGKQLSNEFSSSSSVILSNTYYEALNKAIEYSLTLI